MHAKHIALYASLFGYLSAYSATHAEPPRIGTSEWRTCHPRFAAHIDIIATPAAIDCGFFGLGETQTRLEEIKACARLIVETDKAFKFGYADYGDDSSYCHVAIRGPSGQLWSYFYDSDVSGGSGGPDAIGISKCQTLIFEQGTIGRNSFFRLNRCEPDEDLDAILGR